MNKNRSLNTSRGTSNSNNRSNSNSNNRSNNFNKNNSKQERPIIIISVNPEELFHKSDDEIKSLSDRLNKNLRIARSRRDEKSSTSIEKEICYVQREQETRSKRRIIHEKYFRK